MSGIIVNKSLQEIVLSRNSLTDKARTVMGEVLSGNEWLQMLDLSRNKIKSSGGIKLFQALRNNKSLKYLDVSYNNLGFPRKTKQRAIQTSLLK